MAAICCKRLLPSLDVMYISALHDQFDVGRSQHNHTTVALV
jgi:hypothetical protein